MVLVPRQKADSAVHQRDVREMLRWLVFVLALAEFYELSYDPKRGFSNDATERFDYEGWI